ncbi:hypothetical protein [Chitinophaga barathri]|uniref:Tail fiber domain-containing protein n=1 Tax=Chitinophaga barathri TaxID=1647451 RepID=A0A3N4MFM8_9BACT|nr:hypothetical protein [Chitinophaga barathri]RPD42832.1 hypothetical protein EG028_00600 [Chitinophaga barathri]
MKFLRIAIVALLIQANAFAQKVTYDTIGIGVTATAARLQILDNGRFYVANKAITGQTEDAQGANYILLHESYNGTLSIDRHVSGKITAVRGNAGSFNRRFAVEINTSTAYNANIGTLTYFGEASRLVTLTYNSKTYLAVEILNGSTVHSFSFTGYLNNATLQLVTDNVVTGVTAFIASPTGIQGNLSVGIQSEAARLVVSGGPSWTTNNWTKSIKLYNASAIEFTGATKSFGIGASASSLYFSRVNSDGSGAADYSITVDGTNGNVGIGTGINTPSMYKLAVEGAIGARKVKVMQGTWADFVFHDDYKLPSLHEVESFVKTNKHLPGIPSEAEVIKEGVDVGEMNKLLLQKVEELTLYIIDLKKESLKQQEKIAQLEKKIQ